jgi:hypothetical protein
MFYTFELPAFFAVGDLRARTAIWRAFCQFLQPHGPPECLDCNPERWLSAGSSKN